jgi:hypothetical protein
MKPGPALRLDLSLPPEWARIDPTREAVGLLVLAMFGDDDLRDALAMVSEELLENAIKYSKADTTVSLSIHDEDGRVVVAVTNAVDERSGHIDLLRARLDWISGFPTAADAYGAAIGRVYERKAAGGDGGLGIVRIAYEGRCGIDVDLSEPGKVTVRAACERP